MHTTSVGDAVVGADLDGHLSAWRNQYRVPAVLTSHDFLILWTNRAAIDLLQRNDPAGRVGERLVWSDKGRSAQLAAISEDLSDEPRLWAYDPPERARLLVRIERVKGPGGGRTLGLLFFGGDAPVEPIWGDLRRVFGLTTAESAVVRGLMSGKGADQLAADGGTGLETIRTHIRRAYHKLGVSNREGLYAVVGPLCVF